MRAELHRVTNHTESLLTRLARARLGTLGDICQEGPQISKSDSHGTCCVRVALVSIHCREGLPFFLSFTSLSPIIRQELALRLCSEICTLIHLKRHMPLKGPGQCLHALISRSKSFLAFAVQVTAYLLQASAESNPHTALRESGSLYHSHDTFVSLF